MNRNFSLLSTRYSLLFVFVFAFLLAGCTIDPRYAAEKLFWEAEQKVGALLKGKPVKLEDLEEGRLEEIVAAYRKVADAYPLEPLAAKARFAIANIYISQKRLDEARRELKSVINNFSSQAPIATRAHFVLGKVLEFQGKQKEAMLEFEKITDLYPLSALGLEMPVHIINYYKRINDKEAEERAYRRTIRHYEQMIYDYSGTSVAGVVQDYLARTYVEGDDLQGALKSWDEIISRYPETPQAVRASFAKAEIYVVKMKDIPKAIEIYKETIEEHPEADFIKDVKMRLGDLYLASAQIEEAQRIYSSLIKDYPDDERIGIRSRFALVESFKRQGLQEEVAKGYEEIAQLYPDNPNVLTIPYLMYRYYSKVEDVNQAKKTLDKAIPEYEKELKRRTKKEEIILTAHLLFQCYLEKKEFSKCLGLLETLVDRYPDNPGFLLSIASLYRNQLNNPEKAIEVYEGVIEKYSSNEPLVTLVNKQIQTLRESLRGE